MWLAGRFGTMMQGLVETAQSTFGGLLTCSDTPDMDFVWEPMVAFHRLAEWNLERLGRAQ